MSLNIQKTVHVSFHRRRNFVQPKYTINNIAIGSADSVKYLGVHISHDLNWSCHINHITNSANRALGYLRRNLVLTPPSIKLLATFVRPKLEYANAIFDPYQTYLINTLESVQNRAARFVLSDYSRYSSISALKAELNLHTLQSRRKIARLCLYHKLFHSQQLRNQYIRLAHRISRTSHTNAVYPERALTNTFQQSFFIRTSRDWNDLPAAVATIIDQSCFKRAIEEVPP